MVDRSDNRETVVVAAWAALPTEEVLPGVERQTVQGRRQTLVRYRYAPGAVFPVHRHPEEQITVVLGGRIVFEVDGDRYEVGPGEIVVIAGDAPHGATVVGDEPVETLNALSPRRSTGPRPGPTTAGSGGPP